MYSRTIYQGHTHRYDIIIITKTKHTRREGKFIKEAVSLQNLFLWQYSFNKQRYQTVFFLSLFIKGCLTRNISTTEPLLLLVVEFANFAPLFSLMDLNLGLVLVGPSSTWGSNTFEFGFENSTIQVSFCWVPQDLFSASEALVLSFQALSWEKTKIFSLVFFFAFLRSYVFVSSSYVSILAGSSNLSQNIFVSSSPLR